MHFTCQKFSFWFHCFHPLLVHWLLLKMILPTHAFYSGLLDYVYVILCKKYILNFLIVYSIDHSDEASDSASSTSMHLLLFRCCCFMYATRTMPRTRMESNAAYTHIDESQR